MAAIEILENLYFIERGYLSANHFVYRSENPVLVDTAYAADFDKTVDSLRRLGVRIRDVAKIVNTHTHCDHVGGNRRIQMASGCDIAVHRVGKHFIDHRNDWATWWRYYDQEAEFFECTEGLEDGDILYIGPHRFRVIYTPGHASDGIVLFHDESGILISGDTLWKNDMGVMTLRIEGSRAPFAMEDSLNRLRSLDVQTVYPGHGPAFTDFHKALQRSLDRLKDFMENPEKMADDLLKKIMIYTLLMKKSVPEDAFHDMLMETHWFRETIDLHFQGRHQRKYMDITGKLKDRMLIREKSGRLYTTVKP